LLLEVDPSYPSGHVTGTLALVGIVAVVIGRGRSPAIRAALAVAVVAATALVALTRLYLGVHWLTDVAGGSLLGGAAVLAGSAALAALTSVQSGSFGRRAKSPAPKVTRVA
jgi:undecaprenyl-diphosphatase